jgi:hypothetical protein
MVRLTLAFVQQCNGMLSIRAEYKNCLRKVQLSSSQLLKVETENRTFYENNALKGYVRQDFAIVVKLYWGNYVREFPADSILLIVLAWNDALQMPRCYRSRERLAGRA